VALFEKAADEAKDADVKAFGAKALFAQDHFPGVQKKVVN
jgi:hypothetical protein